MCSVLLNYAVWVLSKAYCSDNYDLLICFQCKYVLALQNASWYVLWPSVCCSCNYFKRESLCQLIKSFSFRLQMIEFSASLRKWNVEIISCLFIKIIERDKSKFFQVNLKPKMYEKIDLKLEGLEKKIYDYMFQVSRWNLCVFSNDRKCNFVEKFIQNSYTLMISNEAWCSSVFFGHFRQQVKELIKTREERERELYGIGIHRRKQVNDEPMRNPFVGL